VPAKGRERPCPYGNNGRKLETSPGQQPIPQANALLRRSGKQHSFNQMTVGKVSWNTGIAQLAIGVELGREQVRNGTE